MKRPLYTITLAIALAATGGAPIAVHAQERPALAAYRINPGDELEVYVWGEERLQRALRVLPDGSFAFPLVGRVEAVGKLPSEIEAFIARGLKDQYRGQVPQVTVSVKTPAGFQFSVIGKVRSPGNFTPGKYVNVLEAIAIAGGPSEFAETGNVLVLRKNGNNLQPIRVRLTEALRGNVGSGTINGNSFPELQSGDTVIVP